MESFANIPWHSFMPLNSFCQHCTLQLTEYVSYAFAGVKPKTRWSPNSPAAFMQPIPVPGQATSPAEYFIAPACRTFPGSAGISRLHQHGAHLLPARKCRPPRAPKTRCHGHQDGSLPASFPLGPGSRANPHDRPSMYGRAVKASI